MEHTAQSLRSRLRAIDPDNHALKIIYCSTANEIESYHHALDAVEGRHKCCENCDECQHDTTSDYTEGYIAGFKYRKNNTGNE